MGASSGIAFSTCYTTRQVRSLVSTSIFSAFDMLLSRRLLEVLENAETDLKKLTRMSPSERQKYFDDGSGFYRHESYLNNVMFCKGTISDIQREEKGM